MADGTLVQNTNATTDVPTNYTICRRTGFKILPHDIMLDGYGNWVRRESADQRHPQERVRATQDRQRGSVSPEPDDRFLSDGEITSADL